MGRRNIAGHSPMEPIVGYSRAVVAGNSVHVSGTAPIPREGDPPEGAYEQAQLCLGIIGAALEAAGASFEDLVKMTAYVVDWDPSMYDELGRGGSAARAKRPYPDVALTLIGVASLFTPEMLVEIDAVAVLDS